MVFLQLRRRGARPDYYRTKAGHEVDFIVDDPNGKMLIQCCWTLEKDETRERELRALKEAAAEMPGSRSLIVTWLEDDEAPGVRVLPYWKWALENGTL